MCVRPVAFPVSVCMYMSHDHSFKIAFFSHGHFIHLTMYLLGPDPTTEAKRISRFGPCVFFLSIENDWERLKGEG